jgi:hypothetical protein
LLKSWASRAAVVIGMSLLAARFLPAGQVPELPKSFPAAGIWKSQTTGNEYRVRIEGDTLYAEWANIPAAWVGHGAYIRTECRRLGSKWIGTSRSRLPCMEGSGPKARIVNWCPLVTRTEIDTVAADRISGRGQAIRRSDCQTCKLLETAWSDFVWTPKR